MGVMWLHRPCLGFFAALIAIWIAAGCQAESGPQVHLNPADCVEVGSVYPSSAFDTAQAFHRAGIPIYLAGKNYPQPQRILVRPEDRQRAVSLLDDLRRRPIPYQVTDSRRRE